MNPIYSGLNVNIMCIRQAKLLLYEYLNTNVMVVNTTHIHIKARALLARLFIHSFTHEHLLAVDSNRTYFRRLLLVSNLAYIIFLPYENPNGKLNRWNGYFI